MSLFLMRFVHVLHVMHLVHIAVQRSLHGIRAMISQLGVEPLVDACDQALIL